MVPGNDGNAALVHITPQEADAIGEILNISMGSAATAVSTMLDRQVSITTPKVSINQFDKIDLKSWEPAMLVTIRYIDGIAGTNMMVFHKHDIQMIINMLMGVEEEPSEDFEFDELSMSAASEVMNQMMGSSATALSSFFGKKIDISTPEATLMETEEEFRQLIGISDEEDVVNISFKMTIPGVLDSEFINIMRCDLAKDLAVQAFGDAMEEEAPPAQPPAAAPAPQPQASPAQQAQPMQPEMQAQQPMMAQQPMQQPMMAQPMQQQPMQPQMQQQMPMQPQMQMQGYPTAMEQQMMAQQLPVWAQPQQMYPMQQQMPYQVQTPQFPDFGNKVDKAGSELLNTNMDLMMGLPLSVSVEIGKTVKKIKDIMDFTQGTIIELEKQAGAPVDIIVNGHLIARGDVVVIDDNFGVRITEIIRTKDLK